MSFNKTWPPSWAMETDLYQHIVVFPRGCPRYYNRYYNRYYMQKLSEFILHEYWKLPEFPTVLDMYTAERNIEDTKMFYPKQILYFDEFLAWLPSIVKMFEEELKTFLQEAKYHSIRKAQKHEFTYTEETVNLLRLWTHKKEIAEKGNNSNYMRRNIR